MWWKKVSAAAAIGVGATVALVGATSVVNAVLVAVEHDGIAPYGQTVSLASGDVNVYRNDGTGPTIVLLSGYGTASPALDFAPLIRELDAFDVIVVEGFGYGYSDVDVADRTVENITAELHEVLARLGVSEPVVLLGHSVGGIYAHYYANAYPDDVAAIVGIDPMVATPCSLEVGAPSVIEGLQRASGLYRLVTALDPDLVQPNGHAYTADERRRIAVMWNWNYGNASVSDEWARITANSTTTALQPLPRDVPVLEVLASETVSSNPIWLQRHQAELEGVAVHRLEVLDGSHYLHWTQAQAIADLITAFLTDNTDL